MRVGEAPGKYVNLEGVPWWLLLFLSSARGNLCRDQLCRAGSDKLPFQAEINTHIHKLKDPFLQELFTPQGGLMWPESAPLTSTDCPGKRITAFPM